MTRSCFMFCKQKSAYEMRISDCSADVCSSDLDERHGLAHQPQRRGPRDPRLLDLGVRRAWPQRRAVGGDAGDRKSVVSGKSVSVRVDVGGSRIIKKTNTVLDRSQPVTP